MKLNIVVLATHGVKLLNKEINRKDFNSKEKRSTLKGEKPESNITNLGRRLPSGWHLNRDWNDADVMQRSEGPASPWS